MNDRLTVGSLFAGIIGGFELGFERTGFQCLWQVEIDPHCRSVLAHHWPDVPRHVDVREVGAHNLAPVDVITFGSPCQDLSVAGKRAGLAGERSGLFHEAIRIIRELRPAIAVWEQVPGVLSSHGGRDFGVALDALADCGALDICWSVLDAQYWRVPQRRRRVFTVIDFGGERASEILALADGLSGHPAPRRETGQGVTASPGSGTDSSDHLAYQATGDAFWRAGQDPLASSDDNGSNHAVIGFQSTGGTHGVDAMDDCSPTIKVGSGLGIPSPPAIFESRVARNGRGAPEAVCPPLEAESGQTGLGDAAPLVLSAVVRRLMPVEAARLQGFPDTWIPSTLADSHHYRMLGNAVAVPVVAWLARRIAAMLS